MTILIALGVLAVAVALFSYVRAQMSERSKHRAKLAVVAEERHTDANDKRRRATDLAAQAADHQQEADRLDREAGEELQAAEIQQDLSSAARKKARR